MSNTNTSISTTTSPTEAPDRPAGSIPLQKLEYEKFAQELVTDPERRYGRAYALAGYSARGKNAEREGRRLMERLEVAQRVDYLTLEMQRLAADKFGLTREQLVTNLMAVVNADYRHYAEWRTKKVEVPIIDKKTGEATGTVEIERFNFHVYDSDDPRVDGRLIEQVGIDKNGNPTLRLQSKDNARRLLAQMLGYVKKGEREGVQDDDPEAKRIAEERIREEVKDKDKTVITTHTRTVYGGSKKQ